jgi:hypothetical protein
VIRTVGERGVYGPARLNPKDSKEMAAPEDGSGLLGTPIRRFIPHNPRIAGGVGGSQGRPAAGRVIPEADARIYGIELRWMLFQ